MTETTVLDVGEARHTALVAGPTDGDIVLFVHGFPDTPRSFDHHVTALAEAGCRVVAPYSRGYEPSSIPADDRFGIMDLARDTIGFVDAIGAGRVHLVGHDWGAATSFIAVPHPARFAAAVRDAPIQLVDSWYMTFLQTGPVVRWTSQRGDFALWRWLWDRWSPGYRITDEDWAEHTSTFSQPGGMAAMLTYYRANTGPLKLLGLAKTEWNQMTTVPVRTPAVTGVDDRCIHTKMWNAGIVRDHFPAGVTVHRMDGVGHWLLLERPEETTQLLLDWFAAG